MEVEEFLKEAAVMKEIKHPNLVQLLGKHAQTQKRGSGPDVRVLSKHHFLIKDSCVFEGWESQKTGRVGFRCPPWGLGAGRPVWQTRLLTELSHQLRSLFFSTRLF